MRLASGKGWLLFASVLSSMPAVSFADDVPLLPRRLLFGNPDRESPRISPDGKRIAYLAPVDNVLNVFVGPADNVDAAKPVTNDKSRGIRQFDWLHTNDHILYLQDEKGDENWRIYVVDLGTGDSKVLTPQKGIQARIQRVSHKSPEEILIGINDRTPMLHDVYRVNVKTGESKLLQKNTGFAGFLADDNYAIRLAFKIGTDGGTIVYKPAADNKWEKFVEISADDGLTTSPIDFDESGKTLYLRDSRGRNTAALVAMNVETQETKVLCENEKADVEGGVLHPTKKTIQAAFHEYDKPTKVFFDQAMKADFEKLTRLASGDCDIVSRTLDDSQWIVSFRSDNAPTSYYLWDRTKSEGKFLFTNRKALEGVKLARMNPVIVKSRDGLDLVCYLSLPPGSEVEGGATPRTKQPIPMVLLVHGGPWARDRWGLNPYHQMLTNRGYAVLSVNYRGSTGFGKEFIKAANLQWSKKMHDDLIDAVQWAVKEGVADPNRVAIMGGSYGGYATLVGLTFTPDTFACGVDIVGPSNLVTLLESVPPYWKPILDRMCKQVGDVRTPEGKAFLKECSPLTHADKIKRPLLIAQGANDPRVKQAESDQIVEAMTAKKLPVTYALFPDEGHGFARPENRLAFEALTDVFLAEHLGGRHEPVSGDSFQGSTIEIKVGADKLKGLNSKLAN